MSPLLWWLLSVAIVIWAIMVVQHNQMPKWPDRAMILFLVMAAATFGGDLYGSLTEYIAVGMGNILSTSLVFTGKKSTIGAMIGTAAVVLVYLRIRNIPVFGYADHIVQWAAFSYAIARIGCFMNGDDFGAVSNLPWSVTFGPFTEAYETHLYRGWIHSGELQSLQVHPVQLYHAVAGLIGFFLLKYWKSGWQGGRFALAWFYYGITRFIIQFFRDDHVTSETLIDTAQWFCILFMTFAAIIWFFHKTRLNREVLVVAG